MDDVKLRRSMLVEDVVETMIDLDRLIFDRTTVAEARPSPDVLLQTALAIVLQADRPAVYDGLWEGS